MLIGSQVLKHWYSDFYREPVDSDYLGDYNSKSDKEEVLCIPPLSEFFAKRRVHSIDHEMMPDIIYTLKCSHIMFDVNWIKHTNDIRWLQTNTDCSIILSLYYDLVQYFKTIHRRVEPDFSKSKEEFFSDKVERELDHDQLHIHIANELGLKEPTYKQFSNDESVELDMDKIIKIDTDVKIQLVKEEILVIACERFMNYGVKTAYMKAAKVCITRLFPIELVTIITPHIKDVMNFTSIEGDLLFKYKKSLPR